MHLIAVDDERPVLQGLIHILEELFPQDYVHGFTGQEEALIYAGELVKKNEEIEYAFFDIMMQGMSGLELAKEFKTLSPATKILFVTGYDNFALEAFKIHARGYILKPVTKELVEEELHNIEGYSKDERENRKNNGIRVQTFGNFDVFAGGKPVYFSRSKAKELFAFLIDRKGSGVNSAEISAALWEDKAYDRNLRNQTQTVISQMIRNRKDAGIDHCVIRKWNYLAVDPACFNCDYYNFLAGDLMAINSYTGEYMSNYSWAEFTVAYLDETRFRE